MKNIFLSTYPGVFCIQHIVYLIISLIVMFTSWILISKKMKEKEFNPRKILTIVSIVLLVAIFINRISITINKFQTNEDGLFNLVHIIPLSFCGLSSLLTAVFTLIPKKDNIVLHCVCYLGFIGGVLTMVYPDFLESQTFFDIRSISGLLHHTILVFLVVLNIITKNFTPSYKKYYALPIGCAIFITFGLFFKEIALLKQIDLHAMQIMQPLLKDLPFLTSWYFVGTVILILALVTVYLFERKKQIN